MLTNQRVCVIILKSYEMRKGELSVGIALFPYREEENEQRSIIFLKPIDISIMTWYNTEYK